MRVGDIKSLVENPAIGPRGFVQIMIDLLEGRDQLGREVPKYPRPCRYAKYALYLHTEVRRRPLASALDVKQLDQSIAPKVTLPVFIRKTGGDAIAPSTRSIA